MAMILSNTLYSSPSLSPVTSARTKPSRFSTKLKARAQSNEDDLLKGKLFMEFPYVSATRKQLMVDLISTVEDRLQSKLLPCSLSPDTRNFKNPNGSAEGSLYIRSGEKSSPIDFVIGSWIHCKIPTGVSLNITSISGFLNSSTNSPNFVFELIQSSPKSVVLILDLPHRKDLVLHPNYLKEYYVDTSLDSHRQLLLKLPEIKPYVSPSLFVRSALSPATSTLLIDTEDDEKLDEILRDHVSPAAKEVLRVWLDRCVKEKDKKGVINEEEKMELDRRDKSARERSVEEELDLQFPRMFGEEVSFRVIQAIKEVFGVL